MDNTNSTTLKGLYTIGGIAAILQLIVILVYSVLLGVLGPKPVSAAEYFSIYQSSKVQAFLRGDFLLLVLIGLYLGTFPALYAALRRLSPVYTALATLFTLMTVAGTFATESSFSLLYLGKQYAAAASEVQQAQFLAAGEAVIASDMWNSSAAYMGGILLQGSGVMISVIMLRSKDFSKITAYSGLLGNAFDLAQHILHPFAPAVSTFLTMFMVFYFVWFVMLARDLLRLAQDNSKI
jgi:hypothetical protein